MRRQFRRALASTGVHHPWERERDADSPSCPLRVPSQSAPSPNDPLTSRAQRAFTEPPPSVPTIATFRFLSTTEDAGCLALQPVLTDGREGDDVSRVAAPYGVEHDDARAYTPSVTGAVGQAIEVPAAPDRGGTTTASRDPGVMGGERGGCSGAPGGPGTPERSRAPPECAPYCIRSPAQRVLLPVVPLGAWITSCCRRTATGSPARRPPRPAGSRGPELPRS